MNRVGAQRPRFEIVCLPTLDSNSTHEQKGGVPNREMIAHTIFRIGDVEYSPAVRLPDLRIHVDQSNSKLCGATRRLNLGVDRVRIWSLSDERFQETSLQQKATRLNLTENKCGIL